MHGLHAGIMSKLNVNGYLRPSMMYVYSSKSLIFFFMFKQIAQIFLYSKMIHTEK